MGRVTKEENNDKDEDMSFNSEKNSSESEILKRKGIRNLSEFVIARTKKRKKSKKSKYKIDFIQGKSKSKKHKKSRKYSNSSSDSYEKKRHKKEKRKRIEWVMPRLIVRVVSQEVFGGKLYNTKVEVQEINGPQDIIVLTNNKEVFSGL